MKKKIKILLLLLLGTSLSRAMMDCDFEEDECGWFSGSEVGEGGFVRTTSEDQSNEGSDLYPTGNTGGHFMYAHSHSENERFSLTSPGALNNTCLMFRFNLNRLGKGSFQQLRISQGSRTVWELRELSSIPRDEWLEGSLPTVAGESLTIEVVQGQSTESSYLAIDDMVLSNIEDCQTEPPEATMPDTTPASSTEDNCALKCKDGDGCFEETQLCDFVSDCTDRSDEAECPPVYLFDDCQILTGTDDCGWKEDPRDSLDWKLVNESMIGVDLDHGGVFLWIDKDSEDFKNSVARIKSPIYRNSNSDCILEFRYYIGGSFEDDYLTPAIYPDGAETEIILDYLTLTDEWKHHSIGIGRRRGPFEIVFLKAAKDVYEAQIAVDDVLLTGCELPQAESECQGERPVRCGNGACIKTQQQCDLSYDCADDSDELGLYCDEHSYLQSTFEDQDKPFGEFEPSAPGLLQWERGSGHSSTRGTGPAFDHTSLDNTGHYLYIDSSKAVQEGEKAEILSKVFLPGFGTDNECEIIFYYHMYGSGVGNLQLVLQPEEGEPRTLWELSGDQGNIWHREYQVVQNSTQHGPYFLKFTASVGAKNGGDIALDDVVFTYNCRLQDSQPTTTPTPAPGPLDNCNFEAEGLCGWNIDFELNNTERFHLERRDGNQNLLAGLLPDQDHLGDRGGHFLWADALFGKADEFTSISSPLITSGQALCFNFWFDVRENAGIKYLKIETEVADDENSKKLLWYISPDHGVSAWTIGRVRVESADNYKIVITAMRSNKFLGFVAIDDFEFVTSPVTCSTLPEVASPTSPAPPSTTTSPGGLQDCTFQSGLCGWSVDQELNDTQWFYFKREFGDELTAGGLGPGEDHEQSTAAYFLWADATLGKPDTNTAISSPIVATSSQVCFEFWFDLKKVSGIRYLQILTEVEGTNQRELLWELRPDQGFDLWEFGRINIEGRQNYKIVVEALRGDSGSGYVAVDDFTFKFDPAKCEFLPPVAKPSHTTTTTTPGVQFPECTFEEDECGWDIDDDTAMKWKRTNSEELDNESLDGPLEAGQGYFMYVGAKDGGKNATTTLTTPMADTAQAGCMLFQFSLAIVFEVFHANNNKKTGFAAIDLITFDTHKNCEIIPPNADPSQTTTTNTPDVKFPDCQFEEDECGWEMDEEATMRWRRTNKMELDGDGLDSPNYDYKGYFMYVAAAEGSKNQSSTLYTPMLDTAITGCLQFHFSMTIYTESNEGYIDYIWDLSNDKFEDDSEWWEGQVSFTANLIAFQVFHANNNNERGYAALDAITFNYDSTEKCTLEPPNAAITTTPSPNTTPNPGKDKFPNCKFESNTCGWVTDEYSNMKWMRTRVEDLQDEGIYDPPKHNYDGYFMYVSARDGHDMDSTTLSTGDLLNETVSGCLAFYYSIYPLGGIKSLKVYTEEPDGYIDYIWDLTDYSPEGDDEWWRGQVNFNTHRLVFEVTHGSNESQSGYAALDSIKFDYSDPSCEVEPPDAIVNPTDPPITSTASPPTIQCDFENSDFCDLNVDGRPHFNFTVKQGEEFASPDDGPQTDDESNAKGHFAYVKSNTDSEEGASSIMETDMINAMDHLIECFEFSVALKKDGGVRSISLYQQSQEQEDHHGDIVLLWFFTSEMADSNDWFIGRTEVHAHYYDEVPQNYTLRLVAEHGKQERSGWAAVDKVKLVRQECLFEPKEAAPPTTPSPTVSTTVPPEDDIFCNFEKDTCNFTIFGTEEFKFKRTKASSIGLIGEDHNHSPDGMILYAEGKSETPNYVWTSVDTKVFKGQEHVIECFHFWFFIDGFLDGNRNETLLVSLGYISDKLNDSIVWEVMKPTPEWTEGQVELRSEMVDDKYVDWQITVLGAKPGDMEAFIAVDDFAFHPSDVCMTMPAPGPTSTPSSSPAPCRDDEFTCGDGTCISIYQECNFMYDCPNDSKDEDSCPVVYDFESCANIEECLWTTMDSQGMNWILSTGDDVKNGNLTNGPFTGNHNQSSNHFMYLKPLPDSINGFAQVATPLYQVKIVEQSNNSFWSFQNSYSECYFNFFVYLDDWEPANHPRLIPKIIHTELEMMTDLDEINLSFVTPGVWEKVEIGIGRHRDHFKIFFFLANDKNPLRAGVAVDDVNFFECAPPPAQDECELENEFHCAETKGCVMKTEVCDIQDDCGDNSDEVQGCERYRWDDFEDKDNPFGHFSQSEDDDFVWLNGNGSTGYRNTGPPFDHTTFSPLGHFLFIPSLLGLPGDAARLWSGLLSPANQTCQMRFFSHMHGHGLGNLTVYIKNKADGTETALLTVNGIDVMDVNKWKRHVVELVSPMDFYVIIEATVGVPGDSDIAVDDITFTPECKFKSGPPTTTQKSTRSSEKPTTKTTTKRTTQSSSKPTSTDWRPETTATTDLIATAAPQDANSQTALIVGLVVGALVLLAIIAVSVVTVKKRNIKIPGIDTVRGLINPGYSRFDDGAMVSLKELSSREKDA